MVFEINRQSINVKTIMLPVKVVNGFASKKLQKSVQAIFHSKVHTVDIPPPHRLIPRSV